MSKKNIISSGLALFLILIAPSVLTAQEKAALPAETPAAQGAESETPLPAAQAAEAQPTETQPAEVKPATEPAAAAVEPPPAVQYGAAPDVSAGDKDLITDELFKAGLAYRSGDYIGALDSLWAAQEAMWRKAPLGVRNVAFVTEQPENFGTYKPKVGETFKSPEPLILYCEPIGFTQLKTGDTYRYSIIGAFDILDSTGRVLGGQKNLGPYEQSDYRTFSTETMLVMTIGIQGLPAGNYVMRVTLTDNLDHSKAVRMDKPFTITD